MASHASGLGRLCGARLLGVPEPLEESVRAIQHRPDNCVRQIIAPGEGEARQGLRFILPAGEEGDDHGRNLEDC